MGRRQTFNTAIAAIMELMNNLSNWAATPRIAPLMQEALSGRGHVLPHHPAHRLELWKMLGKEGDIDVAVRPVG